MIRQRVRPEPTQRVRPHETASLAQGARRRKRLKGRKSLWACVYARARARKRDGIMRWHRVAGTGMVSCCAPTRTKDTTGVHAGTRASHLDSVELALCVGPKGTCECGGLPCPRRDGGPWGARPPALPSHSTSEPICFNAILHSDLTAILHLTLLWLHSSHCRCFCPNALIQ